MGSVWTERIHKRLCATQPGTIVHQVRARVAPYLALPASGVIQHAIDLTTSCVSHAPYVRANNHE